MQTDGSVGCPRGFGIGTRRRDQRSHRASGLTSNGLWIAQAGSLGVRALRRAAWRSALCVFVSKDGNTIGAILLANDLRRETPRAVLSLRGAGVSRIVMVTGDRADAVETIGSGTRPRAVLADREPADKVGAVATGGSPFASPPLDFCHRLPAL